MSILHAIQKIIGQKIIGQDTVYGLKNHDYPAIVSRKVAENKQLDHQLASLMQDGCGFNEKWA